MSDFCIIGAGINGLLLARELVQSGASVHLLERGTVGKEASWAGGGIVSPLYPWRYEAAVTELANWAQAFYPELAAALLAETGIDVEFNRCGLLMLEADDASEALQWAQRYGRNMTEVEPERIYGLEPRLRQGYRTGLWMEEIANVRNPRLLKALRLSLASSSGLTISEQTEVVSFVRQGNKIAAVEVRTAQNASTGTVVSEQIIVTAGAWTGILMGAIQQTLPVKPVKGQMLLYKLPELPIRSIVLHNGRYLIPRIDGHLLLGSTLEHVGFDKTATEMARQSLTESAALILPELVDQTPIAQWAGLRPGSMGGVPLIGRINSIDNLFVSAGHYRNGLVLAPASARLLADLLLGREPILDPAPYDPATRMNDSFSES